VRLGGRKEPMNVGVQGSALSARVVYEYTCLEWSPFVVTAAPYESRC